MYLYTIPDDIKDDFVKHCDEMFSVNEIYSYMRIGSLDRYIDACGNDIEDFIDFDGVYEPLIPLIESIYKDKQDSKLISIFIDFNKYNVWVG